jgi:glyoxylase I family protein
MFANRKIGAVCYFVSNLDNTEKFYRDVLGLDMQRMDDDEAGAWLLATIGGGTELIFFPRESRPGNSPIIVFDLPDGGIDDIVAALAEKGTTIVTPVSHSPGGWSAEFADVDGHVLSMYQSEDVPRSREPR